MTQLVGILNLTPDSFSGDGVHHLKPEEALARIDAMINDGAGVIDVGAESTRPNARPLSPQEEWQRLAPIVEALADRTRRVHFSIDTRHAETARKAVAAGFMWINDVSGGADADMMDFAKVTGRTLVLMHSLSIPADSSRTLKEDVNPVEEVVNWAQEKLAWADREGFDRARLILDPGIGFGKTAQQSLALIKHIDKLKGLGVPVVVGHSRKSFLTLFTDRKASERDPETLAVSCHLAGQRVDYLRVHDIKSHAAMLRIQAAL